MDIPYPISGGVVSGSAVLASPPLLPDPKSLVSGSDIFATSARGSCGEDPVPIRLRMVLARDPLFRRILVFKNKMMNRSLSYQYHLKNLSVDRQNESITIR